MRSAASRAPFVFGGFLLLCACSGRQNVLDVAGEQAATSDTVWRTMLVVCGLMYALTMALLAWALWRARGRGREVAAPPAAGHTPAERDLARGLTGWSALIVLGLVVLSTASFLADRSLARSGREPLEVKVTANQWWWAIEYSGEPQALSVSGANELHLPVGRPARITLMSNDVIHSFWVPNLSGKKDLIPGRINRLTITPTREGLYRGQCAEFCGLQHAKMALDVRVESPADFAAWRARQLQPANLPLTPQQRTGQQVFLQRGCALCHRVAGTDAGGVSGPDLTHVGSRMNVAAGAVPNNRGGLAAWIADPQGVKPGTNMPRVPLDGAQLDAVVAYLEGLR